MLASSDSLYIDVIRPYLLRKVKYFHFPGLAEDLKQTAYLLLEGLLFRIAISV